MTLDKKPIVCIVSLNDNQPFVAINSNSLLNSLLDIEIENESTTNDDLTPIRYLETKKFPLKIHDCEWFKKNTNEIMNHLNRNLFHKKPHLKRNLVISGLKGSGKTTLCKYICNLISKPPCNSFYQYIDCQQFLSEFFVLYFKEY